MDSFCDGPRKPPVPTAFSRVDRKPIVPEISVIEPPMFTNRARPQLNLNNSMGHSFKPPMFPNMPEKHVRFEKPNTFPANENIPHNFQRVLPNLQGDTFKQIYMANVPNRHLDLSILDTTPITNANNQQLSTIPESPQVFGDSYKEFKRLNHNAIASNAPECYQGPSFNFTKTPSPIKSTNTNNSTKIESRNLEIAKPSDEPTIKDLFQIIKQQNEQIMLLQEQVSNLKTSMQPVQAEIRNYDDCRPQFLMNSPTKKGISKFSIDLKATSFEVSFRPQQHKFRKPNDYCEAKIQEIDENEAVNSPNPTYPINNDFSLNLNESLNVKDSYVSAVPSIQINMDQYQSSDEEEQEESSINLGPTFYNELMGQVNTALRSMKKQSDSKQSSSEIKSQTINAVKQATMQHLKSMGVNLPPIEESNETSNGSDNDQSEISFAVKQLLMKYLPDDKLAQAMKKDKPTQIRDYVQQADKKHGTEFSFATMQYMKKYNLLNGKQAAIKAAPPPPKSQQSNPKILDITALKLQPKLL